ncbi:armadillo-type protein [Xylaria acuta]|nr:armadillo-type protein [Xylaria acuta]
MKNQTTREAVASCCTIGRSEQRIFAENLVRGRGLLCLALTRAQTASLPFTPIYASLICVINSKLPAIGKLLLARLVACIASITFIAYLVNQGVAHELVVAKILLLLLRMPTDDSVEIAVSVTKEVGSTLENFPAYTQLIYDRFQTLFQIRRDGWKDTQTPGELDLVEDEDKITHRVELPDRPGLVNIEEALNVFRHDPHFVENERSYSRLRAEILGQDVTEESGVASNADPDSDTSADEGGLSSLKDECGASLVDLRRRVYLTIKNGEIAFMVVECCGQERTCDKFYGLVAEGLAKRSSNWERYFSASFGTYYQIIRGCSSIQLANIGRLFTHLFGTHSIGLFPGARSGLSDLRFSINYFTSIGLGRLTEEMRGALASALSRPHRLARSGETASSYSTPPPGPRRQTRLSSNQYSHGRRSQSPRGRSRSRSCSHSSDLRGRSITRKRISTSSVSTSL